MKPTYVLRLLLPLIALVAAACTGVSSRPFIPTPYVAVPSPTPTLAPTAVPLSFKASTYTDEAEGFELDYPSNWTATPSIQIGSRGASAQLFSPGTTAETMLPGGSRVSVTVYLWDPKGDLASYATHRREAWDASGSTVLKESSGDLMDGRKYKSYVVESAQKEQTFFLFTTLGEKYLEIAGDGDLALIEEIAHTMRPLGFKP